MSIIWKKVADLAREQTPPVSTKVLLRRLLDLQKKRGRDIVRQSQKGGHWEADVAYLARDYNRVGKSYEAQLRELRDEVTALRTENGAIRQFLAEQFGFIPDAEEEKETG